LLCRRGFSPRYLPGEMAEIAVCKFIFTRSIFASRGLYSCINDGGLGDARAGCDDGVVWTPCNSRKKGLLARAFLKHHRYVALVVPPATSLSAPRWRGTGRAGQRVLLSGWQVGLAGVQEGAWLAGDIAAGAGSLDIATRSARRQCVDIGAQGRYVPGARRAGASAAR
jgi:hypothetical protein